MKHFITILCICTCFCTLLCACSTGAQNATTNSPTEAPPVIDVPDLDPDQVDPTTPDTTTPTYNLIYSNEGVYLKIPTKDILSQIGESWKDPEKMAAAETAKVEYIAQCESVSARISMGTAWNSKQMLYNWKSDWSLFEEQDTVRFYAQSTFQDILGWDAVDAFQKDSATFINPDITVTGTISYGTKQHQDSLSFELKGQCVLVNQTDETKLPHTQIRLTNTGFEVDVPYDLLLQESGWTIEELNSKNTTEILYCRSEYTHGPATFQSKQAKMTMDTSNRPEIVTVVIEYQRDNGYEANGEALYKIALEESNVYVYVQGAYASGRIERYYDFRMRCDVVDARTE